MSFYTQPFNRIKIYRDVVKFVCDYECNIDCKICRNKVKRFMQEKSADNPFGLRRSRLLT